MAGLKDWTIMVYLAGDNNLSENMAFSLNELSVFRRVREELGNEQANAVNVNVLAFFDSNSLTAPTQYIDYTEYDSDDRPITKEVNEDNSATGNSIKNFVKWCVEERGHTASSYALIFSGHSEAFKDSTLMIDESAKDNLSIIDLRKALEEIKTDILGVRKIDIVGFDSCLMSTLEVGYELKDVASVIVASQGSLPNSGWGYTALIKKLFPKLDLDGNKTEEYVKDVARDFVFAFKDYYQSLAIGGRSADFSAWDLEAIEPLVRSVNQLAQLFLKHLDLRWKNTTDNPLTNKDAAIYNELRKIILQSHYDAQTYMREQSVDIADFCNRIIHEAGFVIGRDYDEEFMAIISKCKEVIKNLQTCVIECGYVGENYQFSNGISMYFPWTLLTYSITFANYSELAFVGYNPETKVVSGLGKDWDEFLNVYLSHTTMRLTRKNKDNLISKYEQLNDINPAWGRDNVNNNRDNVNYNRDNVNNNRDNVNLNRDNVNNNRDNVNNNRDTGIYNRDNVNNNRDNVNNNRGEIAQAMSNFAKFKNYQLSWKINGYSSDKNT